MASIRCGFNDGPGGTGADLLATWGPTLFVEIGFDPNYKPGLVPALAATKVEALVDTGAIECCIDSILATQLKLPVVDKTSISGAGGAHEVNVYLAHIHIRPLNITIFGRFAGVHLIAGGQTHKALIGRSFLRHFRMSYDGRTGTVVLDNDPEDPPASGAQI